MRISSKSIGILCAVAALFSIATESWSQDAQKSTLSAPECQIPKTTLEHACLKSWSDSAERKLRSDDAAFRKFQLELALAREEHKADLIWLHIRKPHHVCDDFVRQNYPGLAVPINHLRSGVDGQKDVIERRWQRATWWMETSQIVVVALGFLVTIAAAWSAAVVTTNWWFKGAGIVLPALLTAITSLTAFYDFRDVYVAESRASVGVRELQSDIEYALTSGCARHGAGGENVKWEGISSRTVTEWQVRLSAILRVDADSYIKRRETGDRK